MFYQLNYRSIFLVLSRRFELLLPEYETGFLPVRIKIANLVLPTGFEPAMFFTKPDYKTGAFSRSAKAAYDGASLSHLR